MKHVAVMQGAPDLFSELASLCKASVHLTANEHRAQHMGVREYMEWIADIGGATVGELVRSAVLDEMERRDTIIAVQFYPETPIGFHVVYGYDVGWVLREALEQMKAVSA